MRRTEVHILYIIWCRRISPLPPIWLNCLHNVTRLYNRIEHMARGGAFVCRETKKKLGLWRSTHCNLSEHRQSHWLIPRFTGISAPLFQWPSFSHSFVHSLTHSVCPLQFVSRVIRVIFLPLQKLQASTPWNWESRRAKKRSSFPGLLYLYNVVLLIQGCWQRGWDIYIHTRSLTYTLKWVYVCN